VKDAVATGARTAWPAGAQGQGSRPQAVSVTGAERSLDTRRCYLQCTGPPKVWLGCACGSQTCDEAAGTRVPRVPASAGYGYGAALQITALVSGTGSILHDSPERSEVQSGARGVFLRGPQRMGRGGRAVPTSGRECAAPGRGLGVGGQAFRPSAEHGRPEVGLTLGAVVSADSSVQAALSSFLRRRSRSWPLSRRRGTCLPPPPVDVHVGHRPCAGPARRTGLLVRLAGRALPSLAASLRARTPGAEPVGAGVRLTLGASA